MSRRGSSIAGSDPFVRDVVDLDHDLKTYFVSTSVRYHRLQHEHLHIGWFVEFFVLKVPRRRASIGPTC